LIIRRFFMSVSPARKVAYQILRRVESGRGFAIELLESAVASELREVDRRLATELIMGVLRWRGELDFAIEQGSGKPRSYFDPEVLTILRLGTYQIRFLEKIPKSAAVNEAVEMVKRIRKRSAAGLVNAVLRKCEPTPRSQGRSGGELQAYMRSARRAMPAWLLGRWKARFGSETAGALALASLQVPPTMLRVRVAAEREDIAR
jgi:16S rRNA (cytosine967-C5)-methyltransferase